MSTHHLSISRFRHRFDEPTENANFPWNCSYIYTCLGRACAHLQKRKPRPRPFEKSARSPLRRYKSALRARNAAGAGFFIASARRGANNRLGIFSSLHSSSAACRRRETAQKAALFSRAAPVAAVSTYRFMPLKSVLLFNEMFGNSRTLRYGCYIIPAELSNHREI